MENYEKLLKLRHKLLQFKMKLRTAKYSLEDRLAIEQEVADIEFEINWLGEFTEETKFELK